MHPTAAGRPTAQVRKLAGVNMIIHVSLDMNNHYLLELFVGRQIDKSAGIKEHCICALALWFPVHTLTCCMHLRIGAAVALLLLAEVSTVCLVLGAVEQFFSCLVRSLRCCGVKQRCELRHVVLLQVFFKVECLQFQAYQISMYNG